MRRAPALAALLGASAAFPGLRIADVHVFTVVAVVVVLLGWRRARPAPQQVLAAVALVLAVAVFLLSTLGAIEPVRWSVVLQLVGLLSGAVAVGTLTSRSERRRVLQGLLAVTTVSSLVAVLQQFRLVSVPMYVDPFGSRPTGLVGEPDWAGLYAVVAVVCLVRGVMPRGGVWWAVLAVNVGAVLFCFARASWLALGAALLLMAIARITARRPFIEDPVVVGPRTAVALVAVLAIAAVSVPALRHQVVRRVLSIVSSEHDPGTRTYRQAQLDALEGLWRGAPWHGLGFGAGGRTSSTGLTFAGGAWGTPSNVVFGILADASLLAVPLLGVLGVLVLTRAHLLGSQVLVAVFVNSLFSNLFLMPLMWFAIGMVIAGSHSGSAAVAVVPRTPARGAGRPGFSGVTNVV